MRAWLLALILRWLRRLTAWLEGGEPRGPLFSGREDGPPEHWLRRASPPPPAHWLERVKRARPLEDVALPTPDPTGALISQIAAAPQRRGMPVLSAPARTSSPDAPPAGKDGRSFPRPRPAPESPKRFRVLTRVEEGPAAAAPAPGPELEAPPARRRDAPAPTPRLRTTAHVLPEAPPLAKTPARFVAPDPAPGFAAATPDAPWAGTKRTAPFATPQEPGTPPTVPFEPSEEPMEADPRAPVAPTETTKQPVPFVAAAAGKRPAVFEAFEDEPRRGEDPWPSLAVRPAEDDEPWRAALRDAERRRRLDLEQRGETWNA